MKKILILITSVLFMLFIVACTPSDQGNNPNPNPKSESKSGRT